VLSLATEHGSGGLRDLPSRPARPHPRRLNMDRRRFHLAGTLLTASWCSRSGGRGMEASLTRADTRAARLVKVTFRQSGGFAPIFEACELDLEGSPRGRRAECRLPSGPIWIQSKRSGIRGTGAVAARSSPGCGCQHLGQPGHLPAAVPRTPIAGDNEAIGHCA
jgi:hypothetical protein